MNKWGGSNCAFFSTEMIPKLDEKNQAWEGETRTPRPIYTWNPNDHRFGLKRLCFEGFTFKIVVSWVLGIQYKHFCVLFLFLLLKAWCRCLEWPCHCLWILRCKQVLRPTPVFAEGFDPFGEELKKQAMQSLYFIITKHPGTFGIWTVWTICIGPFPLGKCSNRLDLGDITCTYSQGGYFTLLQSFGFVWICLRVYTAASILQPCICISSDVYSVNGAFDPDGMVVLWAKHRDHFWTRTITCHTRIYDIDVDDI